MSDIPPSPIPPTHGLPPLDGWPELPPLEPGGEPEPYTTHILYQFAMGEPEPTAANPFLFFEGHRSVPATPTLRSDTGIAAREGRILVWHLAADAPHGTTVGEGVVVWYNMSPDGVHWADSSL